jgi:hypothetical protein
VSNSDLPSPGTTSTHWPNPKARLLGRRILGVPFVKGERRAHARQSAVLRHAQQARKGGWLLNVLPVSAVPEGYASIAAFLGIAIVSAAAVHWLLEVPVAPLMRFRSPLPRLGV